MGIDRYRKPSKNPLRAVLEGFKALFCKEKNLRFTENAKKEGFEGWTTSENGKKTRQVEARSIVRMQVCHQVINAGESLALPCLKLSNGLAGGTVGDLHIEGQAAFIGYTQH